MEREHRLGRLETYPQACLQTQRVEFLQAGVYICTVQGDLVPWLASQTDILAADWYVVAGPPTVDAA